MRSLTFLIAALGAGPALADDLPDGKRIFDRVCSACHVNDLSEAPQVKQPSMWAARIAKGRDALYQSALNGFVGATGEEMPPRGGRPELSDTEVKAAVDFIFSTVNTTRNTP
ncbi:c-type cytochrome [Thiobacillus sp.]|uniref:c-type cytochrome n=1 Tax=Thiobacillus sp. TaxID=924 RepID=UPI00179C388B|nr:c-type cytochrome [Thiobacillus sp.]MBC2730505.1 cytochrome c5 family protein [Thiobacillus sp.]MBC2739242.1 cytochrome c5 family protein [Thiobacillus sp.]MBC2760473.1 cytochrome c5 family protein [Thiobacillus sp.]MBD3812791.1 cytochrome c5 family protein [Betaproteobacteria bacterium]